VKIQQLAGSEFKRRCASRAPSIGSSLSADPRPTDSSNAPIVPTAKSSIVFTARSTCSKTTRRLFAATCATSISRGQTSLMTLEHPGNGRRRHSTSNGSDSTSTWPFNCYACLGTLHLVFHTVKRLHKSYLERALGELDLSELRVIAMDESAIHERHRHATVIVEPQRRRVVWEACHPSQCKGENSCNDSAQPSSSLTVRRRCSMKHSR